MGDNKWLHKKTTPCDWLPKIKQKVVVIMDFLKKNSLVSLVPIILFYAFTSDFPKPLQHLIPRAKIPSCNYMCWVHSKETVFLTNRIWTYILIGLWPGLEIRKCLGRVSHVVGFLNRCLYWRITENQVGPKIFEEIYILLRPTPAIIWIPCWVGVIATTLPWWRC